jgi:hypothetical protein
MISCPFVSGKFVLVAPVEFKSLSMPSRGLQSGLLILQQEGVILS